MTRPNQGRLPDSGAGPSGLSPPIYSATPSATGADHVSSPSGFTSSESPESVGDPQHISSSAQPARVDDADEATAESQIRIALLRKEIVAKSDTVNAQSQRIAALESQLYKIRIWLLDTTSNTQPLLALSSRVQDLKEATNSSKIGSSNKDAQAVATDHSFSLAAVGQSNSDDNLSEPCPYKNDLLKKNQILQEKVRSLKILSFKLQDEFAAATSSQQDSFEQLKESRAALRMKDDEIRHMIIRIKSDAHQLRKLRQDHHDAVERLDEVAHTFANYKAVVERTESQMLEQLGELQKQISLPSA